MRWGDVTHIFDAHQLVAVEARCVGDGVISATVGHFFALPEKYIVAVEVQVYPSSHRR